MVLSDDDVTRIYRAWNDIHGAASHADLIRLAEAEVCKQHEARIAESEAALAIPHAATIRSGQGLAVQCAIGSIKDAEKFKAALDAARAQCKTKAVTA